MTAVGNMKVKGDTKTGSVLIPAVDGIGVISVYEHLARLVQIVFQ